LVEFKGVTKKYANGTIALRDINLTVNEGGFVFVVGPSGSGKSTLIKLMLREEVASEGTTFVDGNDLLAMEKDEIPYFRRKLGVVFQDFRLLPKKTVYENVAFALEITESLPKEVRRKVPMALGLVGLSRKANSYPNQLSGGEQQRVSLARAIVNDPVLLLADEPTGNLDPETSWEIIKLLESINLKGTTVIVATHDNSVVDRMQKRVIEIGSGRIIRDQQKGFYNNDSSNS